MLARAVDRGEVTLGTIGHRFRGAPGFDEETIDELPDRLHRRARAHEREDVRDQVRDQSVREAFLEAAPDLDATSVIVHGEDHEDVARRGRAAPFGRDPVREVRDRFVIGGPDHEDRDRGESAVRVGPQARFERGGDGRVEDAVLVDDGAIDRRRRERTSGEGEREARGEDDRTRHRPTASAVGIAHGARTPPHTSLAGPSARSASYARAASA